MGGEQSTIGLRLMEVIYPTKGRASIFATNPKAKVALEKEVRKRGLTLDDLEPQEDAVDGDLDADVERCVAKVWSFYDRKGTGQLPKKVAEQFFKDCLSLYAIRQARKIKDVLGKVDYKKALAASMLKMNPSSSGIVTRQEFEQFLFAYDIDEALEAFLGGQGGLDVDPNVQLVDTSQFTNQNREGPKLVYRDYPDD